jgi:hypothetical protein
VEMCGKNQKPERGSSDPSFAGDKTANGKPPGIKACYRRGEFMLISAYK